VGIGASIFLLALGAILAFAVDVSVGWLDLDVVGWILMIVGALGLIMTALIWGNRRTRTVAGERTTVAGEPAEYRRVEERTDVDRPPLP
jgi:hypothetical protein